MDAGEWPEEFAAEPEAEDGENVRGEPESAVREGVAVDSVVEGGVGSR